jgi:hypothetical protein
MTGDQAHSKPDGYWDRAGEQGYGQAMYRSCDVESHARGRVWQTAIDIAGLLGVPAVRRKAMEYAPSYRVVGEDGFRSKDLMAIFAAVGWRTEIWRRLNMFPNFTPGSIYRWLRPLETRCTA